jgi:DNA-binding NtrC family response regulator
MHFLLLSDPEAEFITKELTEVLKPLGSLTTIRADEETSIEKAIKPDTLIIIDATVVEHVEELVARLRTEHPERRIVVLTASPTWQRARAAFEAGAIDYLSKSMPWEELRKAFQHASTSTVPL